MGTKQKQPAVPLPQSEQPGPVKRRRTSAIPPDLRVPRPSLDARDEAKRAAPSTSCAAAVPTPASNELQVIQTLSVASNLSIPSKEAGQDASSFGTAYRFTIDGLVQLVDLLKQLDERAKVEPQAPTATTRPEQHQDQPASRAGGAADPGALGPSGSNRPASPNRDEEAIA